MAHRGEIARHLALDRNGKLELIARRNPLRIIFKNRGVRTLRILKPSDEFLLPVHKFELELHSPIRSYLGAVCGTEPEPWAATGWLAKQVVEIPPDGEYEYTPHLPAGAPNAPVQPNATFQYTYQFNPIYETLSTLGPYPKGLWTGRVSIPRMVVPLATEVAK